VRDKQSFSARTWQTLERLCLQISACKLEINEADLSFEESFDDTMKGAMFV
jgi:hypothetical protein